MAAPILTEDQRVPPSGAPVPKPLQRTRAQPGVSRSASCWSGCGSQRNVFGSSVAVPPAVHWASDSGCQ